MGIAAFDVTLLPSVYMSFPSVYLYLWKAFALPLCFVPWHVLADRCHRGKQLPREVWSLMVLPFGWASYNPELRRCCVQIAGTVTDPNVDVWGTYEGLSWDDPSFSFKSRVGFLYEPFGSENPNQ
jgi:hypothetical protein